MEHKHKEVKVLVWSANPKMVPEFDNAVFKLMALASVKDIRDKLAFRFSLAVRPDQILDDLLEFQPDIVQFIGHAEKNALGFQAYDDNYRMVEASALVSSLCGPSNKNLRACLLTCADSCDLALKLAARQMPLALGNTSKVAAKTTVDFSTSFYTALAKGKSLREALYDSLKGLPEDVAKTFIVHEKS